MGDRESMTVEAIKDAIAGLPEEDRQMVQDFSPGGRGSTLAAKIKRQISNGHSRPLEEGCTDLRKP